MKNEYVKKYVTHFQLHKSGNKFLNSRYEHVLSITNNQIFYKLSKNNWKACKEGDLLISIINNIPLHVI